ncbi:phosphoribosyl-ATP diphosphatase [Methanosarcinaceae archaeon]|jgi:phosphoribosyl-ATP pyrophosphohydrolase|nr:phosphoribosyl-ATP diphosphatase [Methanosarcinaceae archaeon]MBQ3620781.1 phosphoribosyl-ATP diphosphatase [Methanosarcinaceae archaeon]
MTDLSVIQEIYDVIKDRAEKQPEGSYVCQILNHRKGINKILEKVAEENNEAILAVKDGNKDDIIYETADLVFHLLIMLYEAGVTPEEIAEELEKRHKNMPQRS